VGHHFAGASNRFWKLLFDSGLIDEPLTYREDWRLPEWRLGLTNLIGRSSVGIGELSPGEYWQDSVDSAKNPPLPASDHRVLGSDHLPDAVP
jgi:mismatch-specific thymine-DNA glycosylase